MKGILCSVCSLLALSVLPSSAEAVLGGDAPQISQDMGLLEAVPELEGKPVVSVEIELANKVNANKERVRNLLSLKPGTLFSSEAVDKDTKALYNSGMVGNVVVVRRKVGEGVALTYRLESQPLLAGVGFSGQGDFEEKELREQTGLLLGKPVNDKDLRAALVGIRKFYADYNYPDIAIATSTQAAARPGYVDVYFHISSSKDGQAIKEQMVREIRFPGLYDLDEAKLKNEIKTQEKGIFSFLTDSGKIDSIQLDADEKKLVEYLRNQGYMRAKVEAVRYIPVSEKRVDIEFVITQGPKYTVQSVYFGPLSVYKSEELFPGLSLLSGDEYSAQKVADDIVMIRKYYGAKGYADARVVADLKDIGNNQICIEYKIEEGKPYKVGNISIQGNAKTKDYVIRRELPLKPEDNFSSVELEVAQKRLENLNYFNTPVSAIPSSSLRPGYRDINIQVSEKRTGSLTFGVGFSTIDSVVFFAQVAQGNFDLYDWDSFTGGGQRFAIETRLGDQTQNAAISWVEPWFLNQRLALGVELFYARSSYYSDYYEQQNVGTAFSLRKAIGEHSSIKGEYRIENINVDTHRGSPLYFEHQDGTYLKSAVNLSYIYDTRDALVLPRKGGKVQFDVGFAGLGGDVNTYSLGLSANKYWNLKWDTIFSINGSINTIDAWKSTDSVAGKNNIYSRDVPVFDRLYLGGPLNMRGFKYRDVAPYVTGPYGSGDETMGGKSSAFVQFEYTIPIVESVRWAFFYDVGVVNEKSFDFNTSSYCSDWGMGLRLNLPMGPIAVDYAFPVRAGNAIDDGGQFQFYMNYQF